MGLYQNRVLEHPYRWSSSTVASILTKKEYLGHTVNFKTRKHFKDKKSHYVAQKYWQVFDNTQESIVDEETFNNAQKCRTGIKRYPKEWRKNLSDLINQTNEAIGVGEKWEHRSFKDLGLDILPTIHLGSEANAQENKGIHTDRGDYNRKVMELRGLAKYINFTSATITAIKDTAKRQVATVKNEITELVEKR